jgi:hypothetical protein
MSASMAVSPALVVKTDHAGIKKAMLGVLAIVLDCQTAYEGYDRPSNAPMEILEPLWRSRIEAAGAKDVVFSTELGGKKNAWKIVLNVTFSLEVGKAFYRPAILGISDVNGNNEWTRLVNRWPESEKAMAKKECKGFNFPNSSKIQPQATFDALQDDCKKQLEETYVHLRESSVERFASCKFDGRTVSSISMQHSLTSFTLWFSEALEGEQRYLQIQGGFEEFEENWIPRFSGEEKAFALAIYKSNLKRAEWYGKWIDGMVQLIDNRKPSERYAEITKAFQDRDMAVIEESKPETVEPPQQVATTPEKAMGRGELTATYYRNPKTGLTKSFLVKGDTQPIKEQMKEMNGTWCAGLGGWIFGLKREYQFKMAFPTTQWIASGTQESNAA